jgi:hypothetical protein
MLNVKYRFVNSNTCITVMSEKGRSFINCNCCKFMDVLARTMLGL